MKKSFPHLLGCAIVAVLYCAFSGCASKPAAKNVVTISPATQQQPTIPPDPKSNLTLDEIEPKITELPAPASQPSKPAPLDAIQLYARARAKLVDNQRVDAIALLEQ